MKKHSKKVIPVNCFWLSIEGTDAVGKTKLLEKIEEFLRNQEKIKFIVIKEFSSSSLGNLIKDIIKKKKFFSLGGRFHYPLAETLLLCADFIYQFEQVLLKNIGGKKLFIISDRGLYSFLTYQLLRIKFQYQIPPLIVEKWIKNIFQPITFPHFVILLTSPISDIKKRINERDGFVTKKELHFIQEVQNEYLRIFKENLHLPYLVLENRNGNFENVVEETLEKIKALTGVKK